MSYCCDYFYPRTRRVGVIYLYISHWKIDHKITFTWNNNSSISSFMISLSLFLILQSSIWLQFCYNYRTYIATNCNLRSLKRGSKLYIYNREDSIFNATFFYPRWPHHRGEIVWRRHVRWSRTPHLVSELDGQFSRRDDCGATIQAACSPLRGRN